MTTNGLIQAVIKSITRHRVLLCYLALLWSLCTLISTFLNAWTKDYIPQYPEVHVVQPSSRLQLMLSVNHPKLTKPIKYCSLPHTIAMGQEGQGYKDEILEGVIIVTRHGDRGSLHGLVNQSLVSCPSGNLSSNSALSQFVRAMRSKNQERRKGDPFRYFPLLPVLNQSCILGQLSSQGVEQMLQLGRVLRRAYLKRLGLLLMNPAELATDIAVYSTGVPRTYQSALAMMFTFLPNYPIVKNIRMGSGLILCQSKEYCYCPVGEKIDKIIHKERWTHLMAHPAVHELIDSLTPLTGLMAAGHQDGGQPDSIFDSLMVYLCHQQPLPCDKNSRVCAGVEQFNNLLAFLDWSGKQIASHGLFRRGCRLRVHGLFVDIVRKLEDIVKQRDGIALRELMDGVADNAIGKSSKNKNKKPRMVIYSAHDVTIVAILSALGLYDGSKIPYASRFVVELYSSSGGHQKMAKRRYSLRILYNGRDVSKRTWLCHNGTSSTFPFCPFSNFVHYINKSFYQELNMTSFQQACTQLPPSALPTSPIRKKYADQQRPFRFGPVRRTRNPNNGTPKVFNIDQLQVQMNS